MPVSRLSRGLVAAFAATSLLAAPLSAQSIEQPAVTGTPTFEYFFGNLGGGYLPVFGQTFLAAGPFLNSFSFWLSNEPEDEFGGTLTPNADQLTFQAYVAQWNGSAIVGPLLFSSPAQAGPTAVSQRYTFNTGALAVNAGTSYIAFVLVPDLGLMSASAAFEGSGDTSAQGEFVLGFTNDLNALTSGDSNEWSGTGSQLRFKATFSQSATVPEPSTGALMGGAVVLLVAAARRRRAVTRA